MVGLGQLRNTIVNNRLNVEVDDGNFEVAALIPPVRNPIKRNFAMLDNASNLNGFRVTNYSRTKRACKDCRAQGLSGDNHRASSTKCPLFQKPKTN
jgi:hypothetical protein